MLNTFALLVLSMLTYGSTPSESPCQFNLVASVKFTGTKLASVTEVGLRSRLAQHPQLLAQYPSLTIPVRALTFELVVELSGVERIAFPRPNLLIANIRDMTMLVRPAGRLARRIIEAGRTRMDDGEPFEHWTVDYGDAHGFAMSSHIMKSHHPGHITARELATAFARVSERARPAARARPWYRRLGKGGDEMLRLIHEHPSVDVRIDFPRGGSMVLWSPINADDYAAAVAFSEMHPHVALALSAVTLNGLEYTVVMKDGVNVSAESAHLILRAEKASAHVVWVDVVKAL